MSVYVPFLMDLFVFLGLTGGENLVPIKGYP